MIDSIHPVANFFKIDRSSDEIKGPRISPRSGPHKEMPPCVECGARVPKNQWSGASGVAEGRNVTTWLDYAGVPHLIFSQKIVDALVKIGATGFIAHPLPVFITKNPSMWSAWLEENEPPQYYWLEVTGKVYIDRNVYDGGDGNLCPTCFSWTPREGGKISWGERPQWPLMDSWNGEDFVRIGNSNANWRYCTRRVMELAVSEEWTGFKFRSFMPRMPLGDYHQPGWFERYNAELHRRIPWPQDEVPWWVKEKQAGETNPQQP